jgi:hypothetical protein
MAIERSWDGFEEGKDIRRDTNTYDENNRLSSTVSTSVG